jgi:PIN domain nuclease of toxin-antitoxin system
MIAGIADTHTALWYLFNDAHLSVAAGDFIDQAAAAGMRIVVSSISLAEIVYLIEKNRLPRNAYTDLKAALADLAHVFKEASFTVEIVEAMRQVARADVPDMPECNRGGDCRLFRRSCHQPRRTRSGIQRANNLVAPASAWPGIPLYPHQLRIGGGQTEQHPSYPLQTLDHRQANPLEWSGARFPVAGGFRVWDRIIALPGSLPRS